MLLATVHQFYCTEMMQIAKHNFTVLWSDAGCSVGHVYADVKTILGQVITAPVPFFFFLN